MKKCMNELVAETEDLCYNCKSRRKHLTEQPCKSCYVWDTPKKRKKKKK
jgi:hypothetical protein